MTRNHHASLLDGTKEDGNHYTSLYFIKSRIHSDGSGGNKGKGVHDGYHRETWMTW
jgi:hypothetical protein